MNKKDGWLKYRELTDDNLKLKAIVANDMNPDDAMKAMNKELTKVKFQSFGKVSSNRNLKCNNRHQNVADSLRYFIIMSVKLFERKKNI